MTEPEPAPPHEGQDRLGKYVMRCARCKNKVGSLRGEWVHSEKVRCREIIPYRAPV